MLAEIVILGSVCFGMYSFWSQWRDTPWTPPRQSAAPAYHPYQWAGEDQDAHVLDWRHLELLRPSVLHWSTGAIVGVATRTLTIPASVTVVPEKKEPRKKKKRTIEELVAAHNRKVEIGTVKKKAKWKPANPAGRRGPLFSGLAITSRTVYNSSDTIFVQDADFEDAYIESCNVVWDGNVTK